MVGTVQYSVRMVRGISEEVKLWKGRTFAMSLASESTTNSNNSSIGGIDATKNNTYNGNELIIKVRQ